MSQRKDTVKRPYKILHGHIFVHLFWEEGKWGCEGQMPSFGPPQLRHCKLAGLAAGKSRVEQSRYLYLPKYCVNILYFLNCVFWGCGQEQVKKANMCWEQRPSFPPSAVRPLQVGLIPGWLSLSNHVLGTFFLYNLK